MKKINQRSQKCVWTQHKNRQAMPKSKLSKSFVPSENGYVTTPKQIKFWLKVWVSPLKTAKLSVSHAKSRNNPQKGVPSQILCKKDGFTPPNRTKFLKSKNINHIWEQVSLYHTTQKVNFCACCPIANSRRKREFCIVELN